MVEPVQQADEDAPRKVFACNIDARGKRIRLVGGFITLGVAIIFMLLTALGVIPYWGWYVGFGCLGGAIFQIIEGWSGWCAFRAMGFKTKV